VQDSYTPETPVYLDDAVNWVTSQKAAGGGPVVGFIPWADYTDAESANLKTALENSTNSGILWIVGSETSNPCASPVFTLPGVLAVGYSNFADVAVDRGCIDLFAPGFKVLAAGSAADNGLSFGTGAAVAAAQVAGAAAGQLELHPTWSPTSLRSFLLASATPNRLTSVGATSVNKLLYVDYPTSCAPLSDQTDRWIPDGSAWVDTTIAVACGASTVGITVEVHIRHPWRGDLVILFCDPKLCYALEDIADGDSGDDVDKIYTHFFSGSQSLPGNYHLIIEDVRGQNYGYLDSWTLDLL
jgi:subtilisin family serine protease